jgi:eukaryotic-like serine/threonine-protein kinase
MPLAAGQRLGSYEILSIIGVGGMGEVYKARDTRLDRIVALKALPDHVASDPDLRQRFEREAKAISSLSHPHICTLHDIGSEGGVEYLVMEYLEGDTLAQRLTRGALPLPQVLRYAMEIAEALDRAHRQGITHRDLKPGNIMLTKSGAKLLDFGLAKLKTTGVVRSSASAATGTPNVTATGTIIGTLQYMAPEQVEGKPVDQRADIFSFGAIVYEMATGQKAFEGDTQASLIGAILRAEPGPISTLQPLSPPALDALVATCLAKDPDERWQSAGDVARQLRMMQGSTPSGASLPKGAIAPRPAGVKLSLPVALAALVVVAALAAVAVWALLPRAHEEPGALTRFTITPPASTPLSNLGGYDAIVSRDGKRIAYFVETDGNGGIQLYLRDLAELEAHPIPGATTKLSSNGNMNPFFSADGRSIGMLVPGVGVERIALDGGPPVRILPDDGLFLGAVWTADDTWIYSSGDALNRISAGGHGTPERLTPMPEGDAAAPFIVAPVLLPGGRAVLFAAVTASESIGALDLKTRQEHVILENATNPWYVSPGRIVFARGTTLLAAPFDPDRLVITGEPVAVLQGVRHAGLNSAADAVLADNGTLVYVPDGGPEAATATVVWVDRSGHVAGPAVSGVLESPRDPAVSPDGRRVMITAGPMGGGAIWIYDLGGRPPLPLAVGGDNGQGVWSPDGTQIVFGGTGGLGSGSYDVFTLPADGSVRTPRRVHASGLSASPDAWSANGELIVYLPVGSRIVALPVADGPVHDVVPTADLNGHGALSPDGRWLAYESNRSGNFEIWVKRYPDGPEVRVSQNLGQEPVWSRDGHELFYRQRSTVMAVAVETSGELSFGSAKTLFDWPFSSSTDPGGRTYDVAADGRFLMIEPLGGAEAKRPPASIVVVQNWAEEVRRRVPAH